MKVARLSVLRTGRLYPQEIFLVLISVRGCRPQGHSATGRIMSMKNSSDTIWNRTRIHQSRNLKFPLGLFWLLNIMEFIWCRVKHYATAMCMLSVMCNYLRVGLKEQHCVFCFRCGKTASKNE
jgi:hypothetical protein